MSLQICTKGLQGSVLGLHESTKNSQRQAFLAQIRAGVVAEQRLMFHLTPEQEYETGAVYTNVARRNLQHKRNTIESVHRHILVGCLLSGLPANSCQIFAQFKLPATLCCCLVVSLLHTCAVTPVQYKTSLIHVKYI